MNDTIQKFEKFADNHHLPFWCNGNYFTILLDTAHHPLDFLKLVFLFYLAMQEHNLEDMGVYTRRAQHNAMFYGYLF